DGMALGPSTPAQPVMAADPAAKAPEANGNWAGKPAPMAAELPALPQYAAVRVFPAPLYGDTYDGPRVDFRETIFWSPGIRTDAQGKAQVSFFLSDSVTSFRATAEGIGTTGTSITAAHGESLLKSVLPVSLLAKLPLEVSKGDIVELP